MIPWDNGVSERLKSEQHSETRKREIKTMRTIDSVVRDEKNVPLTTRVSFDDEQGNKQNQEVPYSHEVAESLDDAVTYSRSNLLTQEEASGPGAQKLGVGKVLEYFNSTLKTNAAQNARAAFLLTVGENRTKTIERTAKAIAVLQGISVADARKLIVGAGR